MTKQLTASGTTAAAAASGSSDSFCAAPPPVATKPRPVLLHDRHARRPPAVRVVNTVHVLNMYATASHPAPPNTRLLFIGIMSFGKQHQRHDRLSFEASAPLLMPASMPTPLQTPTLPTHRPSCTTDMLADRLPFG